MKRHLVFALVFCMFGMVLFAQEGADTSTTANEPAVTETPKPGPATGEILSPFYERTAERYSDGEIHYMNSECAIDLTGRDEGTGIHHIEYAVDDGKFIQYTTPFKLDEEGNRLIRHRAIDNSGNIEKAVLYQVYIDNSAPKISIGTDREPYKLGDYLYCNERTKFYIEAHDDESGSGIKQTYAGTSIDTMSARGTGVSSEANFFKVAEGQEGVHEFYYTALDNVGNMAKIQKYNIIVDNTPPLVQIDRINWINMTAEGMMTDKNLQVSSDAIIIVPDKQEQNKFYVNANHTIAFKAIDPKIGVLDGSGVASMYVKINDEDFVKYKGPIQFQKAKIYNILVKAEDNAGNISEELEFIFDLDFIRPESTMDVINSDGQAVPEKE